MRLDEALAVIERFFLDVIGTIFSGALFLSLAAYLFRLPLELSWLENTSTAKTILLLGASYAIGHFLTFLGGALVEPLFRNALGWLYSDLKSHLTQPDGAGKSDIHDFNRRCAAEFSKVLDATLGWTSVERREEGMSLGSATATSLSTALCEYRYLQPGQKLRNFNELRNLALSVEGVDKALVYRFQFLGLFNLTTASAVVAAFSIWFGYHLLQYALPGAWLQIAPAYALHPRPFAWLYVPCVVLFAIALLERSVRFHGISMRVPISEALVRLRSKAPGQLPQSRATGSRGALPRVYLAGGFRSGWQNQVKADLAGLVEFVDPSKHGINTTKNYTAWDLAAVDSCDLVFAFLEQSNPGGYALALEIGYAKGQGKTVIYVEEPGIVAGDRNKYLGMIQSASDYTCETLNDGLKILKELLAQKLA